MALPASKVLQIFREGIEAVVSKWKPKKFNHFSIINSWEHLGPLGVEAVEKQIKEEGFEEEIRRETGDKFFMLYGSKSTYELQLDKHEVKIKVESPVASEDEDEDSQDSPNAEIPLEITLDAAKCSEIDLYFKNKFGEKEDQPETEREKLVNQIAKLAGKPGKSRKEEKKLKELRSKLKKLDRKAKEDEAAAAAGGTKKT